MFRSAIVRLGSGLGLMAIAAAVFLGSQGLQGAEAQGLPPGPPLVMYGEAPESSVGHRVHAFVGSNGTWSWCGEGAVVEPTGPGYVVQVMSSTQAPGCGADSRSILLYFTSVGEGDQYNGTAGRLSTNTITWQSDNSVPKQQDVMLGPELEVRGLVPGIAVKVD